MNRVLQGKKSPIMACNKVIGRLFYKVTDALNQLSSFFVKFFLPAIANYYICSPQKRGLL